jgi:hypothetical protein
MAIIIFLSFSYCLTAFSQEITISDSTNIADTTKMPNDQIICNILSNTWLNTPDNMKLMPVSIGAEVYAMTPIIGKKSTFSIAIGFGVGANNIHNNSLPYDSLEITYFSQIPGGYEYVKNKVTTAYVDIPLEFRFRTKPNLKKRNFKVSLGGKFGYLISNYMKYSGEDFRNASSKNVKFKEFNIDNITKIRYGAFLRIGYGKINAIVNYTLSPLFEKDKGPDVVPVSFGLSFTFL